MIEAYLFDMDGTLLDSEILWVDAVALMLHERGVDITTEKAVDIVYGVSWHDIYDYLQEDYPQLQLSTGQMAEELDACFSRLLGERDIRIHSSIALLKRLARQHPVAIVSGSYGKDIERGIALMEVGEDIAFYVSGDHFAPGKPDPACYLHAAEKLGLPPGSCLAFEDSTAGIRAAKGAGMYCVALSRPQRPAQDVSEADLVLPDLDLFSEDSFLQS
jgi:beta-phosphoglucomutase-like phosphatase (HAD superfamily)